MSLPGVSPFSRMLNKSANVVLASLGASTYHRVRATQSSSGWVGENDDASPKTLGAHHSHPSANVTLLRRRFRDLAAALLGHPTVNPVSAPRKNSNYRALPQRDTHHAGFTLIEILVAVALLGMIGAMVFGSLVMTTRAVEAGRDHVAKEQAIRRILRLMNDEISLSKRNTQYPWVGTNGTQDGQPADIVAFLAMSQPLSTSTSKESESVRVVYTRERDRLIRFVRRNLYTLTDTNESVEQMELADRVQAFNIRYYDDQNRIWMDEWPAVQKMPKAVLIEVTFLYPDAEPWTVREWVMIGTS